MAEPVPVSLFALIPETDEARAIVALNPKHRLVDRTGADVLAVRHIAGQQTTDGHSSSSRSFLGYRNYHCYFFLAESGELILRDLTASTVVELANASHEEARVYNLQGTNPRKLVIPKTERGIYIWFGKNARFRLAWNRRLLTRETQGFLTSHARLLKATGMSHTMPYDGDDDEDDGARFKAHIYRTRSRHAPLIPSPNPPKQFHRYEMLGQGSFGVVSWVVDLKTGMLWALKELKPGAPSDRWKESFKHEVEIMYRLRNDHIVYFDSHQDFGIGGHFRLFFRLYEGSVDKLLLPHNCSRGGPFPVVPWIPRFLNHIFGALQFLHQQGVIHRDIKPDNILFDFKDVDVPTTEPNFYLAGFGLGGLKEEAGGGGSGGTPAYMAPELVSSRRGTTTQAADIWALAVTLDRILGYWSPAELALTTAAWNAKLAAMGSPAPHSEPDFSFGPATLLPAALPRWCARIRALEAHGLLPFMFASMLADAAERATADQCALADLSEFVDGPLVTTKDASLADGPRAKQPGSVVGG
ncbi:kinase-like domain-containing protein [Staphylotrichum tortipilum]|uniref:non-specific serine/threonine protein kinase n=1 Tax=Staphylotrichum tortipilum TaxID=2831512 RepID=A0AAN6MB35_9PEZI|nr:kinase-like domain-containing protein [Staphylotrichum longicolle]